MTPRDEPDLRGAEGESRAQRLGSALRGLAAGLVNERHKVAELRRSVAELTSRLEAVQATQSPNQAQSVALLESRPRAQHAWAGTDPPKVMNVLPSDRTGMRGRIPRTFAGV